MKALTFNVDNINNANKSLYISMLLIGEIKLEKAGHKHGHEVNNLCQVASYFFLLPNYHLISNFTQP